MDPIEPAYSTAVLLIIAALGILLYQATLALEKQLLKPYARIA